MRKTCLLGIAFLAALAHASTYYVSTNGSDVNPGSLSLPWKTIQHACNSVKSGDAVLVETGIYHEAVTLRVSMTLAAATNAKPVIDGTGLIVPNATSALVFIENLSNVAVRGFEIRNYTTAASTDVPCGIFVDGVGSNIRIQNNVVHGIANNGSDPSSINAFGIAVYGDSASGPISDITLSGNNIFATKTGNSETLTLNGNVTNFVVARNVIHDVNNIGIDCIGFEGTSPISNQDRAREGLVESNSVFNVSSLTNPSYGGSESADGIYVDGGKDIIVQGNIIRNADIGIEVASEHANKFASGITVWNNLILTSNVVGLSIGGFSQTVGGTQGCRFFNNTLYENDTTNSGSGEMQIQYHTSGNVFGNNLLVASSQGVIFSGVTGVGSAPGMICNNDLYFTSGAPNFTWNGNSYLSLADFSSATGNDKNSLFATPSFRNASMLNFELLAGSFGINSGSTNYVRTGETDLAGASRTMNGKVDVGCYETG